MRSRDSVICIKDRVFDCSFAAKREMQRQQEIGEQQPPKERHNNRRKKNKTTATTHSITLYAFFLWINSLTTPLKCCCPSCIPLPHKYIHPECMEKNYRGKAWYDARPVSNVPGDPPLVVCCKKCSDRYSRNREAPLRWDNDCKDGPKDPNHSSTS